MKQKIWLVFFILFGAVSLLSACAEQQNKPSSISTETLTPPSTQQPTKNAHSTNGITGTLLPSKTSRPTNTPYPTRTPKATTTACAKNPLPAEFLASQPELDKNKLFAFSSKRRTVQQRGYSDIYTAMLDGSNLNRLTYYSGDDDMSNWSSDGKQILFLSDRNHLAYLENELGYGWEPFKKELFIMNIDGTYSRKVTADLPYYSGRSPDGKYIAYAVEFYDEERFNYLSNVFVENISGSYKENITSVLQPGAFGGIDWSPDGKHFAFTGITPPSSGTYSDEFPVHIYLANADGSNLRKLDEGAVVVPGDDSYGYQGNAWSSDGKRLAFLTSKGIAIVNGDGTSFTEYPLEQSSYATSIFWLDDNQHLIFVDSKDAFYKINVDFTNMEKLPLKTDIEKLIYSMQLLKTHTLWNPKNHYHYDLSPDGKWLAYIETGIDPNRCSQIRILSVETGESYFVIDREGLIPYLLKHSSNHDLQILDIDFVLTWSKFQNILWSSDSKQLLFTHSYFGLNFFQYQDFFAVNLDGTDLHMILDDVWNPVLQP